MGYPEWAIRSSALKKQNTISWTVEVVPQRNDVPSMFYAGGQRRVFFFFFFFLAILVLGTAAKQRRRAFQPPRKTKVFLFACVFVVLWQHPRPDRGCSQVCVGTAMSVFLHGRTSSWFVYAFVFVLKEKRNSSSVVCDSIVQKSV